MTFDEIVDLLGGVTNGKCRCPAHDDRKPSLSVSEGDDGRTLLHCFAGCSSEDVLAKIGLTKADLFARRNRDGGCPHDDVARYRYVDEHGAPLYDVVRKPGKQFHQEPASSKRGSGSMTGVRRVLYRLPEVISAVAAGEVVYVCEGEKDVDRVRAEGVTATCNPQGAGEWGKVPDAPEVLAGAQVFIVADADEPGWSHAREVARSLLGTAAAITVVRAVEGKDASDHLAAGHHLEYFDMVATTIAEHLDDGALPLADWLAIPSTASGAEPTRVQPNGDDWPNYVIPAWWWEKRDILRATRDWAIGRFVPPEILLAHVFAELALRIPTSVVLPPIIGGPSALNFGATIVAETGVGKTAGGRGLLHSASGHRPTGTSWPLGSGQGLVETLVDSDDKGEKVPHGRPVLIHADEGRALEELFAQSGSTLISTLCSAISGAELGQTNATKGLRRRVPAHEYRIAVVLNLQPVYLKGVLADVDGGLPQRFLFVSGTGHHLHADADEPATALSLPDIHVEMFTTKVGHRPTVHVPEAIRTTIVAEHVDRLRRLDEGKPVARGSHRNLLRLRIATLLALAEGRTTVTDDDWGLAVVPVDASDATIARGEAMRAAEAARRARAETDCALCGHAVASDAAVELDRVERLAIKVTRRVRAEPGTTRKAIRVRMSAANRAVVDEAIDHAIATERIVERSEPGQGDDKRALYVVAGEP